MLEKLKKITCKFSLEKNLIYFLFTVRAAEKHSKLKPQNGATFFLLQNCQANCKMEGYNKIKEM